MDINLTLMLLPYWLILLSFLVFGGKRDSSESLITDRLILSLKLIGGLCAIVFILAFVGGKTLEFYVPHSFKLGVNCLLPMVFCWYIVDKVKRTIKNTPQPSLVE